MNQEQKQELEELRKLSEEAENEWRQAVKEEEKYAAITYRAWQKTQDASREYLQAWDKYSLSKLDKSCF